MVTSKTSVCLLTLKNYHHEMKKCVETTMSQMAFDSVFGKCSEVFNDVQQQVKSFFYERVENVEKSLNAFAKSHENLEKDSGENIACLASSTIQLEGLKAELGTIAHSLNL